MPKVSTSQRKNAWPRWGFPPPTRSGVGFTLIEAVVVIGISAFVMVGITRAIVFFYDTNEAAVRQAAAISSARSGIDATVQDIREATYSESGEYPVVAMEPNGLTFFADVDEDETTERVRYWREDTKLKREVSEDGSLERDSVISRNVVNDSGDPVFTYFDADGNEITDLSSRRALRFVMVTLRVDADTEKLPSATTLRSGATLRNR